VLSVSKCSCDVLEAHKKKAYASKVIAQTYTFMMSSNKTFDTTVASAMTAQHHTSADIEMQAISSAALQLTTSTATGPAAECEVTLAGAEDEVPSGLPWSTAWRLYLSHFLSTWNSRSFEFASVLFLAAIYPHTLLYLSIYAISRCACAIIIAPMIGDFIDRNPRLRVVRLSIGKCCTSFVQIFTIYLYANRS
jgi:hypothetical protein